MNYYQQTQKKRRQRFSYMLPFFVLIIVSIFIVAIFKIFIYFFTEEHRLRSEKVIFYSTDYFDLLSWGSSKFKASTSGTLILDGDKVKTKEKSKNMMLFYDANIARIEELSEFNFNSDIKQKESPKISLTLQEGRYWFDFRYDKNFLLQLDTTNLLIDTNNALFDVFIKPNKIIIKVFDGTIKLKAVERTQDRVRLLDQKVLAAGYQAEFNNKIFNLLKESMSIEYVSHLSSYAQVEPWYVWNQSQSKDPKEFLKTNSGIIHNNKIAPIISIDPNETKLIIFSPKNNDQITNDNFILNGSVLPYSDQIEIIEINNKGENYYKLKKFQKGDQEFVYRVSKKYGNLVTGENTYRIMATSFDKKETIVGQVKVIIISNN